jgi:hypothetical protein
VIPFTVQKAAIVALLHHFSAHAHPICTILVRFIADGAYCGWVKPAQKGDERLFKKLARFSL